MSYEARHWIETVWIMVAVFWALTTFRLKPVVQAQRTRSRLMEISPLIMSAMLLFSSQPHTALLDSRFLPDSPITALAGIALTVAGAAVAIVARAFLGRNWSGRPTIREGHALVRNGPYAFVRHPIYTGLLVSAIGAAIAFGHVRNLLALPLLLLGFWLKLQAEEGLLFQTFGDEYLAYRRSVKSTIIPFIL
jgi:protein-S-isoprenylcysteine O-methyltransferase Ste14